MSSAMPSRSRARGQRGIALVVVLWIVTLLALQVSIFNLTVRDVSTGQAKMLASRTINLGPDGNLQTETLMFDVGGAGARTLQIAAVQLAGEENTSNNSLTRLVNVGSEPRRILYIEGEPRWEYKFIRQAEEDDRMVQIVSMVRTSENKVYRQGIADPKELASGYRQASVGEGDEVVGISRDIL